MSQPLSYSDTLDVRITDSSLRDGSHAKGHQFTEAHVATIVDGLAGAGVPVIEVTHGDGLAGSSYNLSLIHIYDPAVLTDEFVEMRWTTATTPEALAGIRRIYSREMLGVLRDLMLDNTETLTMLRRIQAPTLVTWGRDDRVTPLDGFLVPMRLIRDCELHVFPDCGHWAMVERKAEWERVVRSFLTRDLDPSRSPA